MYSTGLTALSDEPPDQRYLANIIGNCDPYGSLTWGALSGLVVTVLQIGFQRLLPIKEILESAGTGALMMVPALTILWLASCLSVMTGSDPEPSAATENATAAAVSKALQDRGDNAEDVTRQLLAQGFSTVAVADSLSSIVPDPLQVVQLLKNQGLTEAQVTAATEFPYRDYRMYTGVYLGHLLSERIAACWMPTIVFVLASFVAFATGTSWGTMGIIMPLVIPLVYSQIAANDLETALSTPLMLASVGSVLSGAIFGDHCSPISDTTVLSSQASGCDHMAHVVTQMPYALAVGLLAIVFGTIPVGFGIPVWIALAAGIVAMPVILLLFGKRINPAN
jgi:hypothetical protein